ncbi:hypothetical protein VTP01DRAFT_1018 [Rhizomucor pusillus]|uniref:uncharacterized protein n=1 Tax=Rhizomucor pusillus TaxID=4840 RepID=UPI0037422B15
MATYGAVPQEEPSADVERQQLFEQGKDRASWRVRLGEWIENEKVHWTILLLVLVDATCVLFQIIYTFLHECQSDRRPTLWIIELVEAAEITSMIITCLFMLELTIALVAFGPRYCLPPTEHWKLHILDVVVVLATFIFDIILHGKEREVAELLIILRLWRVIRVVEAAVLSVSYAQDESEQGVQEELEQLKTAYAQLEDELKEERELREKLQKKLEELQDNE